MKKLSQILIILGVIICISPLVGQWYTEYRESRMIEEWLNSIDVTALEEEASERDPEEIYSQLQEVFVNDGNSSEQASENAVAETTEAGSSGVEPTSAVKPAKSENKASEQTVIGIIQIDKIKLRAPIVEGVSAANLKAGIGHIPGTAHPGQPGNCALAGHRNYTFGKFFNRLDELVEGDKVVITTKKEDLVYKVYKKHVVTPDDVSVLKGSKEHYDITLITCTPIYVATHRLILHARLEERVLKEP